MFLHRDLGGEGPGADCLKPGHLGSDREVGTPRLLTDCQPGSCRKTTGPLQLWVGQNALQNNFHRGQYLKWCIFGYAMLDSFSARDLMRISKGKGHDTLPANSLADRATAKDEEEASLFQLRIKLKTGDREDHEGVVAKA
jgi:hypothetical protein